MRYRFSLAYLTVMEVEPPEAVQIAADTGYQHVGLRLWPAGTEAPFAIFTDQTVYQATQQVLAETGITVADIEIIRLNAQFQASNTQAFLECGAGLGAKHILVAGDDPDLTRCTDNFAAFCELAAQYQMTADLEFMPWTQVPNLKTALQVIHQAQQTNAGLLIDALHFARSASTLAELATVDPALIHYVQFCDAPLHYEHSTEGLIHTARAERLMPGDGELDLLSLFTAVPKGEDLVVSLEIPQKERASTVPAQQRAAEALQKMQACLNSLNRFI
ncbi:Sugar phosphate isomerase/epimerase [Thiothrix eikelboomii]|uniref:Sugar phosphate isomerase/epimerase n=1 Tax=Thiothrix eikelboomii TaxID=92487 RepID=A0A1T4W3A2_9GAMM|nr:sugar phosphate isomerase/epimerase [Thiothrix eikelboomii]SKA71545.1 Sugar phosphate isomerase/epimerase [Thiothrix eikelboomii]